eukprot:1193472-Prorocentrum_minimum.AAC.2
MLAGPKRGEQWAKVGNWTKGEKRGGETRGVECTLALIGTGGPEDPYYAYPHVLAAHERVRQGAPLTAGDDVEGACRGPPGRKQVAGAAEPGEERRRRVGLPGEEAPRVVLEDAVALAQYGPVGGLAHQVGGDVRREHLQGGGRGSNKRQQGDRRGFIGQV